MKPIACNNRGNWSVAEIASELIALLGPCGYYVRNYRTLQ